MVGNSGRSTQPVDKMLCVKENGVDWSTSVTADVNWINSLFCACCSIILGTRNCSDGRHYRTFHSPEESRINAHITDKTDEKDIKKTLIK